MFFTFISGATGGIGKAFAVECAERGYNLFLTGRSLEKLNQLKQSLVSYGVEVVVCECELTDACSRTQLLAFADKLNIKFDRIINVAGVDTQMAFESYTIQKVEFQIKVNVEATICLTHQLLSRLSNGGQIITVSSLSGASPMPYFALYSASKAMLTNFFSSLHYELKNRGIKVTVVTPGGVYTRPDVCEDIKGQGLWGKLSAKTPEYIAVKSLNAVNKNKRIFVPGFFNKLLNFTIKIAPKRWVLGFIAKRWKKQIKDAF